MDLSGTCIVLDAGLQKRTHLVVSCLERLLHKEAQQESVWVVAFSVKFDAIECTHDAIDDSRSQANRFASSRGDEATVHLFVGAVVAV